jgi:hypothetical protein
MAAVTKSRAGIEPPWWRGVPRKKLDWKPGIVNGWKPKGMYWNSIERLTRST